VSSVFGYSMFRVLLQQGAKMSFESQIVLKNDGWEIKTIEVKKYSVGEGLEVNTLSKLDYSTIMDILQQQSYANTDLVVIDVGDMRKLMESILIDTVKTLNHSRGINSKAA